ncbi:hypothetical protein AGLY_005998 [Aphis glycines]|uniref:Uncharacterized protein n=1 Tax=Aphis glycines TaxID=307491 RepID=A0A6G0TUT7_APHGL|nr:hypothetical protein AGLY_005998 [Aphis glycines]
MVKHRYANAENRIYIILFINTKLSATFVTCYVDDWLKTIPSVLVAFIAVSKFQIVLFTIVYGTAVSVNDTRLARRNSYSRNKIPKPLQHTNAMAEPDELQPFVSRYLLAVYRHLIKNNTKIGFSVHLQTSGTRVMQEDTQNRSVLSLDREYIINYYVYIHIVCKIYDMIKIPSALQLGRSHQPINVTRLIVKNRSQDLKSKIKQKESEVSKFFHGFERPLLKHPSGKLVIPPTDTPIDM